MVIPAEAYTRPSGKDEPIGAKVSDASDTVQMLNDNNLIHTTEGLILATKSKQGEAEEEEVLDEHMLFSVNSVTGNSKEARNGNDPDSVGGDNGFTCCEGGGGGGGEGAELRSTAENKWKYSLATDQTVAEKKNEFSSLPLVKREDKLEEEEEKGAEEEEEETGSHANDAGPESPEGGWGWVVVFGAFVVYWLVPGMIRSYGAVYLEILDTFPESTAAQAGWIPALLSSISIGLAPISAVLGKMYTCRNVVFVGGLFCSLGLSLSYFADSIFYLYITFGLITGIGAGLCTTPSVIVVNAYFVKKRALASGFCLSGAAVGSFTIPIFVKYLVSMYRFRGTMLIMGGIILHVCACSLLFTKDGKIVSSRGKKGATEEHEAEVEKAPVTDDQDDVLKPIVRVVAIKTRSNSVTSGRRRSSTDRPSHTRSLLGSRSPLDSTTTRSPSMVRVKHAQSLRMPRSSSFTVNMSIREVQLMSSSLSHSINDVATASVFYQDSFHASAARLSPLSSVGPPGTTTSRENECDSSAPSAKDARRTSIRSKVIRQIKEFLKMCLDFTLFREWAYVVTVVAGSCIAGAFPHVLFFVPAFAQSSLGASKVDAGMLLSICSGVDLVSRISYGWFMDTKIIRRSHGLVISCAVCAIGTLCIPLSSSYGLLALFTSMYGFGSGTCFMLLPVILADNHGVERLPSTYGLMRFFQGTVMLTIPPLAGLMKDTTGKYDYCFIFMGMMMAMAAVAMLFMPCAQRMDDKTKTETLPPL